MAEATQTVAPTTEPVTLDECKSQLRLEIPDDDPLILSYIAAARSYVEAVAGQQLVSATWQWKLDGFQPIFYLPHPPLQSVTTFTYLDTAGASQSLTEDTDFQVDTASVRGRIMPSPTKTWPATQSNKFNTITITYVAGHGAINAVPENYKQAIRLLVAHQYREREPVLVGSISKELDFSVNSLLWIDRVKAF
jgi:uncharacterized phiE125 gp8 family phage protein